ncbi:MAG: hypothetical protein HY329_27025 [Chloroflexi bacterium]|nr:hypothetical protein [Chloroflexota bacterium]
MAVRDNLAKRLLGGSVVGVALVALTASPLFAQTPIPNPFAPAPPNPPAAAAPTHEQMHQMMDARHGAGASQRMHDAMGPDREELMDQCVSMMGLMGGGTAGMMGGQNGQSRPDMMSRMMGR